MDDAERLVAEAAYNAVVNRTQNDRPPWDRLDLSEQYDWLAAARAAIHADRAELLAAASPVAAEIREGAGDVNHHTWNPTAHVEVTLTIAECRAIVAAVRHAAENRPG